MIEAAVLIGILLTFLGWLMISVVRDCKRDPFPFDADDEENYGIPSAKPVSFGHEFDVKGISSRSWCHVMAVKDPDGMDIYLYMVAPVRAEYIQGLYAELKERGGYTSAFSLNTAVTMAREATAREKRGQPLPESRASLQDELPPSDDPSWTEVSQQYGTGSWANY